MQNRLFITSTPAADIFKAFCKYRVRKLINFKVHVKKKSNFLISGFATIYDYSSFFFSLKHGLASFLYQLVLFILLIKWGFTTIYEV